jgi:hypothetical protein
VKFQADGWENLLVVMLDYVQRAGDLGAQPSCVRPGSSACEVRVSGTVRDSGRTSATAEVRSYKESLEIAELTSSGVMLCICTWDIPLSLGTVSAGSVYGEARTSTPRVRCRFGFATSVCRS